MHVVRFTTATGSYAVPVDAAREVRKARPLRPLPAPRPGIAGILERDGDAMPVLDALGAGADHVLVLEADEHVFGLLVGEVEGVGWLDDTSISPAPAGQDADVVTGSVADGADLVLIVDPIALLGRFHP